MPGEPVGWALMQVLSQGTLGNLWEAQACFLGTGPSPD